jgi:ABC-2 type transport system ATP-binding protein
MDITGMHKTVLQVSHLTKDYTSVRALDDLNLEVMQGECFGLLGPNGAGKTTLIKILLNLIASSSGTAAIFNQPVTRDSIREKIGYLPEKVRMYGFLTGREFLDYQGKLYGMKHRRRKEQVEACLKTAGMYEDRSRKIGEYSKGMVQRIGLAQALLNSPELLLLDEPAAGLDPISNKEMRDILLKLKEKGVTIFINSHLLSEVEMVCDRVAILHRGRLVRTGTKQELTAKGEVIEFTLEGISDSLIEKIQEIATQVKVEGNCITINPKDSNTISAIPEIIINQGGKLLSLNSHMESLEDIFLRLIKGEENSDE